MEVQFEKSTLQCMLPVIRQAQTQEQTQEVRLPDGMPDIGRVVSCWAQPVIRSKEWRSERISVGGGIMSWVLYVPEEGGSPQSVAVWLPYQMKWDIPQTQHDGTVMIQPFLRSADARSLSSRKLMVRASLGLVAEAMAPGEIEVFAPPQLPEDLQLLERTYPVQIPQEAGEKAFQIEEEFSVPTAMPTPQKIVRYELRPELMERKLMTDKAVFRGVAAVDILYLAEDGQLYRHRQEIPFSQYAELDKEYDPESTVQVVPVVTNLELDLKEDGTFYLRAGISGQYVIYSRPLIQLTQDAYSPNRAVTVQRESLQIPSVLDTQEQTLRVEQTVETDAGNVLDLAFYPDYPQQMRDMNGTQVQIPGTFSLLYTDPEGALQSTNAYWEETMDFPASADVTAVTCAAPSGKPVVSLGSNGVSMQADLNAQTRLYAQQGLPMVTGLTLGEEEDPNPDRPSLILRRASGDSLWDIAKGVGSTVEKIRLANGLTSEPDTDRMLLIPIL